MIYIYISGCIPRGCCPSWGVVPRGPWGDPQGPALRCLPLIYQTSALTSRRAGSSLQETEPDKPEVQGPWSGADRAAVLTLLGDLTWVPSLLPTVCPSVKEGWRQPWPPGGQGKMECWECWAMVIIHTPGPVWRLGKLGPRGWCPSLLITQP